MNETFAFPQTLACNARAYRPPVIFFGISLLSLFLLLPPSPSTAQYFGRNKVKYEDRNFRTLQTDHFTVYFYPEEKVIAHDAGRMAERWYARHSAVMEHTFKDRKPILLYADQPDFQQTNAVSEMIQEGTGGVTEPLKDRVILPFTGYYRENDHVLGHELVHAFQFDIAMHNLRHGLGSLNRLPLWMIEGMAEYYSLGPEDPHTAMWLRDALLHNDLPSWKDLATNPRYFPYRFGQAFYAFIGATWGDTTVTQFMIAAANVGPEAAADSLFGCSPDSLVKLWQASIRETYSEILSARTPPEKIGRKILSKDRYAGSMNLCPAISPDGKTIAFLSERDIFSIDLFLADAQTGKIIRKLSDSERNFHFDAISFSSSAGAWSPDASKLAVVVYADGDNQIAIFNVHSGKILRQLHFRRIGAITGPAWSPNGRFLAFSGMSGGISDLYLFDFQTDSLIQLTRDKFAQWQPAWSPDGKTIAFVTDQGDGTDFRILASGPLRVALMDLKSRSIQPLNLFPRGKHISPQFSPDGQSLYFVSDQDGISDIYRYSFPENQIYRVTRVATGISGLTRYSPTLSVASRSGDLIFSVFQHFEYNVYGLSPENAAGTPVREIMPGLPVAGILPPPAQAVQGQVARSLHDYTTGLPSGENFVLGPYRPNFQLDYIGGQAAVGVSTNRYNTLTGGGVNFLFSDMLGDKVLGVAAQLNGELKDFGGQLLYLNRAHRWNWGAVIAHQPYLTMYQTSGPAVILTNQGQIPGNYIITVKNRSFWEYLGLSSDYPFSITQRFELNLNMTRIWYQSEIDTIVAVNSQVIRERKITIPGPPGANLAQPSVAYVGDYSYFGFTSPTRGGRYRFEIEQTFGSLAFTSLLGDYRRYFFFRPFTLAFRLLHYGRYGKDSESDQLSPLYIGSESLVRGYPANSYSMQEFVAESPGGYRAINNLFGSRIAVVNVEFRIPLLGTERFGLINFPYFPTEVSFFFDGGLAWTSHEAPKLKFSRSITERVPIFSTGISFRINLLGYTVVEAYLAHPFQRPQKEFYWGFQFAPGW